MSKLTPEGSQIRDIINGELEEALYKVMEVKALNVAIYNSANDAEQLENLCLLIKVQEQILNSVIEGINLVDNHISDIVYHREEAKA